MILLVIGIKIFFDYASTTDTLYWIMGSYVTLCLILFQIKERIRNKTFYSIFLVVLFPFTFIYRFIIAVLPIFSTQIYLFIFLVLSFSIPIILYSIDELYGLSGFKGETWIYLIATFGSITATIFHKQLTFLTFKIIPFTSRKASKIKRSKLVELCEYIVSKENIKVVIHFIFFITLIIFTILGLEEGSYYANANVDNAILQAFATFLAFERTSSALSLTKFRASELLKTLKLSLFSFKKDQDPK